MDARNGAICALPVIFCSSGNASPSTLRFVLRSGEVVNPGAVTKNI